MCPFLLEYLKIYIFCKEHLFFWPLPLVQIFQQMQLYVNIIIQKKKYFLWNAMHTQYRE